MCMSLHVLHVYMYISPEERFCCMDIMVLIMGPVLSSESTRGGLAHARPNYGASIEQCTIQSITLLQLASLLI